MYKHILYTLVFVFSVSIMGCAGNQGNTNGNNNDQSTAATGTAALSLQFEEGAVGLSLNNYQLDFTTFALAFSQITLGDQTETANFAADFFDEEVTDIVELEDIPTGEYESLSLKLGEASGLNGAATLQVSSLLAAASGEEVTETLNGLSVLIIADAQNGADSCTLRVELSSDQSIEAHNDDDNHVEVNTGEEAEVLVAVDTDAIFGTLNIPASCTGDAVVTVSDTENAALGEAILSNMEEAFHMESTDGHDHDH